MANSNKATDLGLQLVEITDTLVSKQASALEQFGQDRTAAQAAIQPVMTQLKSAGVIDSDATAKAIETALSTHTGALGVVKSAAEVIVDLVGQIQALQNQPKTAAAGPIPATPAGRPANAIGKPGSAEGKSAGDVAPATNGKGDWSQQATARKRASDEEYLRRMNLTPSKPVAASR